MLFHPRSFREWGQTLGLMAIALPAFIGAMGVATDIGNLYFNHYKAQTAVDAAAIAGALCLPGEASCTATTTARTYAITNGLTDSEVTVGAPAYNTSTCPSGGAYPPCQITVSATRTVPYYFSRLVGITAGTVNVSATAAGGTITTITSTQTEEGGVGGMMPIGLQYNSPWTNGSTISLAYNNNPGKCGATGTSTPGDWNFLALPPGTGESTLESNLTNGYTGPITVGGTVSPEPGAGQPAFNKMAARISNSGGTTCTFGCNCNSPCIVTVVLVDWATMSCGGGRCSPIAVKGFAQMCIDSSTSVGSCSQITGHAVACPVSGGSWTTVSSSTSQIQDGTLAVKLLQ